MGCACLRSTCSATAEPVPSRVHWAEGPLTESHCCVPPGQGPHPASPSLCACPLDMSPHVGCIRFFIVKWSVNRTSVRRVPGLEIMWQGLCCSVAGAGDLELAPPVLQGDAGLPACQAEGLSRRSITGHWPAAGVFLVLPRQAWGGGMAGRSISLMLANTVLAHCTHSCFRHSHCPWGRTWPMRACGCTPASRRPSPCVCSSQQLRLQATLCDFHPKGLLPPHPSLWKVCRLARPCILQASARRGGRAGGY